MVHGVLLPQENAFDADLLYGVQRQRIVVDLDRLEDFLMPRKISLSMTSCCGEKVTAFSRCPTTPIPTAPARTGNTVLMVVDAAW